MKKEIEDSRQEKLEELFLPRILYFFFCCFALKAS
jgi:hypothetical protein